MASRPTFAAAFATTAAVAAATVTLIWQQISVLATSVQVVVAGAEVRNCRGSPPLSGGDGIGGY